MTLPERLRMIGAVGSPYTRKMLSLLRYRRIPYSMIWGDPATILDRLGIAKPKVNLLPTLLFEDEQGEVTAVCDSTPIIRRLEHEVTGRATIPPDPALAFINYLLEDFADEWCTKYMFHYRWYPAADADNAGTLLPLGMDIMLPPETLAKAKQFFSGRQIGRLGVVGSSQLTAPIIDASYRRLLVGLEAHFQQQPFLLGARPGSADFALFGQLSQLVGFDPTPRQIAHEISPRTVVWVGLMEDQCGLEPQQADWNDSANLPPSLIGILQEVGRVYVPALLANFKAVQAGEKVWSAMLDGHQWQQQSFPYQAKCLQWINDEYRLLAAVDRQRVDSILAGTGCEAVIF